MRANREIAFLASSFTHRSSTTNFATNAALFHSVAEINNARRSPGALLKSSPIVVTSRNPLKHKGSVNMSSATNGNTIIPSNHTIKHNTNLLRRTLQRLQSSPTQTLLLDGGTGEELFRVGVPDDRKIWSATAIVHPQYHSKVEEVHKRFIAAGSGAITTNSYGIVPGVGFKDGEEVKRLMHMAGKIARGAARGKEEEANALVMGSLGPLVESYRPDLVMKHNDGAHAYTHAIEGLYPHIDIYLAETMSCLEEAWQVVDALSTFYDRQAFAQNEELKQPLLVSFTLGSDGKIRSGESVVDAIPTLIEYAFEKGVELIGVMFNCCEPEIITKALQQIQINPQIHHYFHHPPRPTSTPSASNAKAAATKLSVESTTPPKILLGAYANRLTHVDPEWTLEASSEAQGMREDLSPEQYWEEFVRRWQVQLIGGCCGIGPEYIACLRKHLSEKDG